MARNDEGEFELVLGNRQLISVFLIVAILFAVFFSMGYIVGRNSGPSNASKPIVVEHPATAAKESAAATAPEKPSPEAPAGGAADTKPSPAEPAATHAQQPANPPAPAPQEPTKKAAAPAKETKPSPAPPPAPAKVTGEPAAGEYWQVVATSRPDAEIISEALAKKGFHSVVAPGPRENIFRVLVGPVKDKAQARSDLEAAGFKNPIMRKY